MATAIVWFAWAGFPGPARADGDPASDVLAAQPLFLPQDAGISVAQQDQLARLLRDAAASGYRMRVALIATRGDLGSVTELWRRPQTYAQFLAEELSLVYRGPLLVVMPHGFGFWRSGADIQAERSTLAAVRIPGRGAGLAIGALGAVQRLAAASGHPVSIPPPSAGSATARPKDSAAAIALVIGAALIAVAWAASLRARPPRIRRGKQASV